MKLASHNNDREQAPLTAQENGVWRRAIAATMLATPLVESDLQKAGSLSLFEYQVLSALDEAEGSLTMSQLAALCNSSLSRLSHVARKLEQREALIRTPAVEDKRVTMAEITPFGSELVRKVSGRYSGSVRRRVLNVFTEEELQELDGLASKLLYELDPDHPLLHLEDSE